MIKTSTQIDVVKYVYNETSEQKSRDIESAFVQDEEIANCCIEVMELKREIINISERPSQRVTDNIMAFARKSISA